MNNFIVRTLTGIVFVATIVISFMNPTAMVLLFALITGLTVWEFTGLVNEHKGVQVNRFISSVAAVYLFVAMAGYNSGFAMGGNNNGNAPGAIFIPYLITIIYLLVAELYLKAKDPISNWAYTMMAQLYIALPFSTMTILAFPTFGQYNLLLPLSIFVFLWVNDSGAYCVGSLLGRHKLFPRISPGKSWEGSIGGGLLVVAVAVLVWYLTDMYDVNDLGLNAYEWAGLGLVVVIFGTWGDLIESLFKRTLGIKDSGNVLPGHGGMLDRFDSTLMAVPAAVVYLYTLTLI